MLATMYRPLRTIAMSRAEYMRSYRQRNNVTKDTVTPVTVTPSVTPLRNTITHDHIPTDTKIPSVDTFAGIGRGIPVNGYVLTHLHGIVSERAWLARLQARCAHATHHRANGWACACCGS